MGSTRLPGKVLKKICDRTMIEHILLRLRLLKNEAKLILATSTSERDDVVESFCTAIGVECFRGSEKNVLERYYDCAKKHGLRHIVRLTADNPFVDIEELDNLIDLYFSAGADYANSFEPLPVGVGAEIFNFFSLEKSYADGKAAHHIEHVNEYMLENPDIFKTAVLKVGRDKSRHDVRLTVDTEEDYRKACYIVKNANGGHVTTQEAIRLADIFSNGRGS